MKFLSVLVAVLAAHSVDSQSNIGLPPPPPPPTEDTPGGRQELDDGVHQDSYIPIVEQQREKMSADEMDFDYENSIEERKSCVPTDLCSLAGGHCVKKAKDCDGTIDARGCRGGKKCKCCVPDQAPCVDNNKGCKEWADNGECFIDPMYMLTNCKLSCKTCVDCAGGCGPGTCTGPNTCNCPHPYQQIGYTCINPANFNNCFNYVFYCDHWASEGDCDLTFVKLFCKKACNLAPCGVHSSSEERKGH